MDLVVKESYPKKILALYGEEIRAESEYLEEKILSLQLSSDGKEVVYVTEKYAVMLFNIEANKTELILKLDKPIKFLKMINIDNSNVIVCGWTENHFKVRIKQVNYLSITKRI